MQEIVLVLHNIRSTHNVGAIFRTAEGFGIRKIFLSGYTPYPEIIDDKRLPHIRQKLLKQIHKTALGAEELVPYDYYEEPPIDLLRTQGYTIVGLEQSHNSVNLHSYIPPAKIALLLGEEVHGLTDQLVQSCEDIIEIPMSGKKESFNVSVATGIALYALTSPKS